MAEKPNPVTLGERFTQIVGISDASGNIINPASGTDTAAIVTELETINTSINAQSAGEPRIKDAFGFPLSADAFGRLRVSEPYTIFDNSLTSANSDTLFWSTLTNGVGASGTYVRANAKYTLSVTNPGEWIVRQTKMRFKYQPGKSHFVKITGLFTTEAGKIKRAGLVDFDNVGLVSIGSTPQNGIFFENAGGVLSWHIYNNGVENDKALQSQWNYDKFDGNGPSGYTLDMEHPQIIAFDLEWLGVGTVLVGFVINRHFCPAHAFNHANVQGTEVYMRTANLPVAYQLISISGAGTMSQICCSVESEGGFNPNGVLRAVDTGITGVAIGGNSTELMVGMRLQEDFFEYTIIPLFVSIMASTSANARFFIAINPTYSGAVTWVPLVGSAVEYAINNNNAVTAEGLVVYSGYFSANSDSLNSAVETALRIGKSLQGTPDELWLCCSAIAQNETFFGAITFKELV